MDLNKKLDSLKAVELLESKTKDLPTFEARQIKKRLAGATAAEVESKFQKVYESVKDDMKTEAEDTETTIEEEVKDIIEAEEDVKEDDILKNKPHNKHVAEGEEDVKEDDLLKNRPHNKHIAEGEDDLDEAEGDDLDEAEDDEINESVMAAWVKRCSTIDC